MAQHRSSVDQRRQLRPNGGLASGQKTIDGLIQAFGRRARWQAGLLGRCGSGGAPAQGAPYLRQHRGSADRYSLSDRGERPGPAGRGAAGRGRRPLIGP
jgi:hypothetical protein